MFLRQKGFSDALDGAPSGACPERSRRGSRDRLARQRVGASDKNPPSDPRRKERLESNVTWIAAPSSRPPPSSAPPPSSPPPFATPSHNPPRTTPSASPLLPSRSHPSASYRS